MARRDDEESVTQVHFHEMFSEIRQIREKLDEHCTKEHKEFQELVDWMRGAKMSGKIIGWITAILFGITSTTAAIVLWVKSNLTIGWK